MFGTVSSMLLKRCAKGRNIVAIAGALVFTSFSIPTPLSAAQTVGPSGLPLPRFVTTRSTPINVRVGPGTKYGVAWVYVKAGTPVEIIQEFDTWRRVRDADGSEGWINQSLLSGRRTAMVAPWQRDKGGRINLFYEPDKDSGVVAMVEPGVMGSIKSCNGQWCEMTFDGHTGWLSQSLVWGAYPGEKIKD